MALLRDRTSGNETEPPTVDVDTVRKQVVAKLDQLARQKAELDQLTADLNAQLAKFDAAFLDKMAAADLGNDLAIVVTEGGRGLGWSKPPYTVGEVVKGKVGEMQCYEMDILGMYLTRAFNDSKGPKKIRIYAEQNWSHDQIYKLFAVCAQAGYQKARFILPEDAVDCLRRRLENGQGREGGGAARRRRKST